MNLLVSAFDMGVTFFDTADTYGDGYGERVLARALGRQRHELVIATKVGYDMYTTVLTPNPTPRELNFGPRYVRYACEQSLRRLNTDYIDLYQLHDPTMYTLEDDELFDTLENLVREGKIRYYGFAPEPSVRWEEEAEAAMRERDGHALQLVYNMLEQRPGRDLFPIAVETNTGLIAREPHARGALSAARPSPVEGRGTRGTWSTGRRCRARGNRRSGVPDQQPGPDDWATGAEVCVVGGGGGVGAAEHIRHRATGGVRGGAVRGGHSRGVTGAAERAARRGRSAGRARAAERRGGLRYGGVSPGRRVFARSSGAAALPATRRRTGARLACRRRGCRDCAAWEAAGASRLL